MITLLLVCSDGESFKSMVKSALLDFLIDITAAMPERFGDRLDKRVLLRKYTEGTD